MIIIATDILFNSNDGCKLVNIYPSIGIDPSDHVFVVDRENSRIEEFDNNGTFINKWYGVSATDKFKRPEDITFSTFGIFITDTGNNRVLKVDEKFNLIKQWGTKGTGNGQFIHPTCNRC